MKFRAFGFSSAFGTSSCPASGTCSAFDTFCLGKLESDSNVLEWGPFNTLDASDVRRDVDSFPSCGRSCGGAGSGAGISLST